MAQTSTDIAKTKIVVNAYGQSSDDIAPHFRLMVDGKDVGQATVKSASPEAFVFETELSSDQQHKIQIVYDNDEVVKGQDRNLGITSIVVGGKTLAPTEATYERHDDAAPATAMDGQEGMWWNGALTFVTSASASGDAAPAEDGPAGEAGDATIVVNAQGTAAGGRNAHFTVLADGTVIGEGTAGTQAQDFAFTAALAADRAHDIQVRFDNDAVIDGADRNLRVNTVTVNGHEIAATDASVRYDKGAPDGLDVVAGQADLPWNGTLVVTADRSLFASGGTAGEGGASDGAAPSAPAPTDTPSGSDGGAGRPVADGHLRTEGSQIVDSAGNAVKLTGVNWFGAEGYAFAPQGMWQDSYQNIMDQMREVGFNTIRLPWSDAMLDEGRKPTGIDYSKNPDLAGKTSLEVFDAIVAYADEIGMKIILDHHRSGDGASANENGLWYTSQYPESTMIRNWQMLAERYADNPSVIAADLHNEPHGQATWGDGNQATDWKAAAERIGNAIQEVNPNWLLIVEGVERSPEGTYWWGGNLDGVKTDPVEFNIDGKLVYSVHDYPPSMAGFGWFNDSDFPNSMADVWTDAWGYIVQNDIAPVLVGEFGTRYETAKDQQWLNALAKYMDGDWNLDGRSDLAAGEEGPSWTYWAWSPGSGDTGGLMRDDWTLDTAKMSAIEPALFDGTIA